MHEKSNIRQKGTRKANKEISTKHIKVLVDRATMRDYNITILIMTQRRRKNKTKRVQGEKVESCGGWCQTIYKINHNNDNEGKHNKGLLNRVRTSKQ